MRRIIEREKLTEGVDSIREIVQYFGKKKFLASDIIGSLWDSMFDENNLPMNFATDKADRLKLYEKIMDLYYDLKDYEDWYTNEVE